MNEKLTFRRKRRPEIVIFIIAFFHGSAALSTLTMSSASNFKILGVCGGICSGKSTACKLLRDFPGAVGHIDADSLAHEVYAPGSKAIQEISDYFGDQVIDKEAGVVDRKALGSIVFSDQSKMSALEQIVWPHVKNSLTREIEKLKSSVRNSDRSVAIVEAAVMLDAGWQDIFDGIWVVRTQREAALYRMVENRGIDVDAAALRIDAQISRRGIGNADEELENDNISAIIENEGSLEDFTHSLKAKVRHYFHYQINAFFRTLNFLLHYYLHLFSKSGKNFSNKMNLLTRIGNYTESTLQLICNSRL